MRATRSRSEAVRHGRRRRAQHRIGPGPQLGGPQPVPGQQLSAEGGVDARQDHLPRATGTQPVPEGAGGQPRLERLATTHESVLSGDLSFQLWREHGCHRAAMRDSCEAR